MSYGDPDDYLTRELARAGIDIDAEQHARLTELMAGMRAAELPVGPRDIIRLLDMEPPRGLPRWRLERTASVFRGDCPACGHQFQLTRQGVIPGHVDATSKAALVRGKWRRARCTGSGLPPH